MPVNRLFVQSSWENSYRISGANTPQTIPYTYILCPTPYTLYPIPYTLYRQNSLYPIPYTLYTLHPTPYTLHPMHPTPYPLYRQDSLAYTRVANRDIFLKMSVAYCSSMCRLNDPCASCFFFNCFFYFFILSL